MTAHKRTGLTATSAAILLVACISRADTVIELRCKPHHGQVETPVMMDLSGGGAIAKLSGALILAEEGTARRIAAQVVTKPARVLCFVVPPRAAESDVRRFRVTTDRPGPAGLAVDTADKDRIVVTESGRDVLTFVRGQVLKSGVPDRYRRSCYLHPIHDLDGAVLTDDFPRDHYHHRGLSWVWPRVEHAGKKYDMWSICPLKHRFVKLLGEQSGPVCAVLRMSNRWELKGQPVVDEKIELCIWRAGKVGRAVDVFWTVSALDVPVSIGGRLREAKGYGGFNIRFAPRRDTVVYGPKGRQPGYVNRVRMAWSDLSARFVPDSNRVSGLAIFDSPGNPGFPSGWSNRSYGYLNPGWPGLGKFELAPGRPLRLRYRVWIHRGDAVAGKVSQVQKAFVDPPDAAAVSSDKRAR